MKAFIYIFVCVISILYLLHKYISDGIRRCRDPRRMGRPHSLDASSSSSSTPQNNYDVFLSFRGDTRNTFTSHLYNALDQKGIYTFLDVDKLERGADISPGLENAVGGSRCSVVILSGKYASSRWCMDELVNILRCRKDARIKQIVLPIFYHVNPDDILKKKGNIWDVFRWFGYNNGGIWYAFRSLEKEFSYDVEKVETWRAALIEVATIAGYSLQDGNEANFIKDFIKVVSSKLDVALFNISKNLVGMKSQLEKLRLCVSRSPFDDVRFIGICGMGGIGKTTLARAYFEHFSYQFEASSFLANVREVCEKVHNGLETLQKQLLTDILKGENTIRNVYEGKGMMIKRLSRKKVLVILDDVDQLEQLEGLAEENSWFGCGSRIILTTRDESLLSRMYGEEEYIIHMVDELKDSEALQLFSLKAFKSDCPPKDYKELSEEVMEYANGLPLALVVLGSFLRGKRKNEWKSALDRLKKYPQKEIMRVLRISFDVLEETEKNIFLDIACFFNGSDKDYIVRIMDSCDFFSEIGIRSLVDKSLLHMEHDNKLRMHDLLEEMGKEIVKEKSRKEPGRRSRIWLWDDFYHVMHNDTGTEEVEAIVCNPIGMADYLRDSSNMKRGFSNMKKLRLLIIMSVGMEGCQDVEYFSNELLFLEWEGFPFNYFPPSFRPHGLVELSLRFSKIKQLWNNPMKPLNNLKSIDLTHSYNIRKLEGFSLFPNLEKLILDYCGNLEEIDPSITVLKSLTLLSLHRCRSLKSLPTSMDGLESLKVLNFGISSSSSRLRDGAFPDDFGCLVSLEYLDLSHNYFSCLPACFNQLSQLRDLDLTGCENLTSLGPELPYSLESVMVNNCSELHTFLDPLSQCNLRCSTILCVNCFKLGDRQGSKRTAITSLARYLQNHPSPSERFDIVLPGDEIPSWFTHQVRGSSSISLPLPRNWCTNKWIGFALSVCFTTELLCFDWCTWALEIKINQEDWGFGDVHCLAQDYRRGSDHLWLFYLPRDTYFHTEWPNKFGHIQFSLKSFRFGKEESKEFKECGVRLVYEQDIEELNLTARHEPIIPSANEFVFSDS